jgi:UPF0755 protein
MSTRRNPFGCLAISIGFLIALGFVAFFGASTLIARAEESFGPPAPHLPAPLRIRLGIELGWRADALLRPVDTAAEPLAFAIGLNEPTGEILTRLQGARLIRDANLFSSYLVYSGLDTQLQAGSYQLSAMMNSPQIAEALLDPTPASVTLVILPGWRLEEIAGSLPSAGVTVTPEDFLLAAWSPPAGVDLPVDLPSGKNLEGYLLPGSYEIDRTADAVGLLNALLLGFHQNIDAEFIAAFEQHGLTLHEALTLASIVEREAVLEDEMPMIASVFHNRLAAGMKLEADPTVQYAVGYDQARTGWWPLPISVADLRINSPYNTYVVSGLPPGPIASPDLQALTAVAFPANSPYYFFQAACDGSGVHIFEVTFEEHVANNCQ